MLSVKGSSFISEFSNCYDSIRRHPIRIWILYFVAASASFATAMSAIGRLLLYLTALFHILRSFRGQFIIAEFTPREWVSTLVLLTIGYMLLAVTWSVVDPDASLFAWSRHSRLLTIPIVWYLIHTEIERISILRVFVFFQIFVVLSSWLLVFGLHVPWATDDFAKQDYSVYGSYLEESIAHSVLIAILWFQQHKIFGKNGRWFALMIAFVTLVLTIGFLKGRTGHLACIGVITVACIKGFPKRFKWISFATPLVVAALFMATSTNFKDRMMLAQTEFVKSFESSEVIPSTGERLEFWKVSLMSIAERPVLGSGPGSWNSESLRLDRVNGPPLMSTSDNPHQLFLLWAVEGGLLGLSLLLAVFFALYRYSLIMAEEDASTLQAVLVTLAIAGFFTSVIYGIGMGDYFCIAIGIVLGVGSSNSATPIENHKDESYSQRSTAE